MDHQRQLPYGVSSIWLGSESRKMDFYDYFQTMPCNVRVLLRPSPITIIMVRIWSGFNENWQDKCWELSLKTLAP